MFRLDEGNKSLLLVPYSLLKIMYIRLIRNKPQGNAITGRLVIDGRWFCYTLERVGYQIPALCYHVVVTMSPKFKRLLPLVQNVPRIPPVCTEDSATSPNRGPHELRERVGRGETAATLTNEGEFIVASQFRRRSGGNGLRSTPSERSEQDKINKISRPKGVGALRLGIRFHRGTRPEHSTGCILVVADNPSRSRELIRAEVVENNVVEVVDSNNPIVGCRSAADVEKHLTDLILKAQNEHEEIILEVTDFTPGTEYGYNTPCVRELQQHEIDARRAEQRYYELHPEECKG